MPSEQIKLPGTGIHDFDFEEELLLFDEHTQKILLLNSTSKAVWKGLKSGISIDEIVKILARATRADPGLILSDVNSIISKLQKLGFFKSDNKKESLQNTENIRQKACFEIAGSEKIISSPQNHHNCIFKIIDTTFRFNAPGIDILNLVIQQISHLLIHSPCFPDIELSLVKTDRHYILYKNKIPVDFCSHIIGIIPMLHAIILMSAYERSDCLIGLHAAAVICGKTLILLPAPSGSGKSTLTIALIHSEFTYGADDLVLLTAAPVKVIPVPTALGMKQGSWSIVESWHPKIWSYPIHKRSDNKIIRYLPPPEQHHHSFTSSSPMKISIIVYPDYQPDHPLCLDRISPAKSACLLAAAGFDANNRLDKERVLQLFDWVKTTPSYRLTFSHLEGAVSRLKSLCTDR